MTSNDLILNIAVNLGRLGRWALEKKEARIKQFIQDTDFYLNELERASINPRFIPTFHFFKSEYSRLSQNIQLDETWAESMFTWANILTHRAKLA